MLQDGQIVEYTELVNWERLMEDAEAHCFYEDAVYIGVGVFSHFGETS